MGKGSNALGYNKTEYKKAVQGLAMIKAGKKTARITFIEKENRFEDTGSNIKEFSLDELPSSPVIPTQSEDQYFVKLERKEGCDVEYIGPSDGVYPIKPIDMSRPEQEADPLPYDIIPRDPKFQKYSAFNVYYKITAGDFKGCTVSQFFHYLFEELSENAGYASWKGNPDNPKAKWLPKLIEFCTTFDIVGEPIDWAEDGNVLPELLSRLLASKNGAQAVIKNGYVDTIVPAGRSTRIVEAEDEPAPKAKAKTASKSKTPPSASKSKSKNDDLDF